ncbi:MAG: MarR family transcriptional regulator [Balneolaceae bacterium]
MGTHHKGTDEERETLNAFIKLMRASETINNRLNRSLAENEMTVSQFGTLEVLYHLGPLNQRAIGRKLLKTGGNITMVIDNLEKHGLVRRERDPDDRRAILIHLTDEGRDRIREYFPEHLKRIVREFSALTPGERSELARICKKLGTGKE